MTSTDVLRDRFNAAAGGGGAGRLLSCLDVPRWVDEVAEGGPYAGAGRAAPGAPRPPRPSSPTTELDAALARHPRIGERAGAGHDAEFSAPEQAGVDGRRRGGDRRDGRRATPSTRAVRPGVPDPGGRPSSAEILAELRRRLGNTTRPERAETVAQLREIALLPPEGRDLKDMGTLSTHVLDTSLGRAAKGVRVVLEQGGTHDRGRA